MRHYQLPTGKELSKVTICGNCRFYTPIWWWYHIRIIKRILNHYGGVCEGKETDLIVKKVLHMLLLLGVELQQGCYGAHQLCGLWRREPINKNAF